MFSDLLKLRHAWLLPVNNWQVTGVGRRELGPVFAEILRRQGRRALIVHSTDGLDEISPSVATDVWEVSGSPLTVREYQVRFLLC